MLNRMQTELEYSAPPLEGLLECLCATELGAASSLVRVCRERLAVCGDFPSAWREAVKRTAPRLNAEDRASLLAFGQGLGTTDLNGQRRGLALYLRLFDEARTRARSEREKYGAYLPRLSLLLGLCGAVLLL
jgi:stage III sporulation protein AB